ncbi:MAG: thiamine pyrophosphate-dependent dehydrogenase E1 component subunit alpha, partial [SAR324 cluster bacterium]|nr:thiamine pyrophosphate-dependent dehydrogenase E1 component subunit alpha [SAR324 cluster bacterium]
MEKAIMTPEIRKKLYFEMLRIRMIEQKIAEVYPEQEMRCPVHLCIGQEAVAAGVCANLKVEDQVVSAHRSHAHYLAKGGDLKRMLGELYGKVSGCAHGKGGSMHLIDLNAGLLAAVPIVGSTIPIGVGAAWGMVMKQLPHLVVVFFGDGSIEEGVFHESLNFAALKKLPVLFLCENNFYSVYSPLEVRQPAGREIFEIARAHGIESHQGDGNDVEEVYSMTAHAVEKIRQGKGPMFLEFKTFRWLEHCGPFWDDELGYRKENELQNWRERCPVKLHENKLRSEGLLNEHDMV